MYAYEHVFVTGVIHCDSCKSIIMLNHVRVTDTETEREREIEANKKIGLASKRFPELCLPFFFLHFDRQWKKQKKVPFFSHVPFFSPLLSLFITFTSHVCKQISSSLSLARPFAPIISY